MRVVSLPPRRTGAAKRPRRYVISRTLPDALPPRPGFESWVERFELRHLGGHGVIHKPLLEADVPTIIQVPRKQTAGSITDEQLTEAHASLAALGPREAVVVCENMDSENAARGRARSLAERYAEDYAYLTDQEDKPVPAGASKTAPEGTHVNPQRFLTSHAIPDPNHEGKWIGAVSVRADQTDPATKPPKPKPAAKAKPSAKPAAA